VLASADVSEGPASFSPDGLYLAYTRRALVGTERSIDIWALPLFGDGKPFPIVQTKFDDVEPEVAPNGKWMTYWNAETGRRRFTSLLSPTQAPSGRCPLMVELSAKWRRDGKELFFLDQAGNVVAVDVDTSSGAPRLGSSAHAFFRQRSTAGRRTL